MAEQADRKRDGRGGARPGSGPRRRRLYLDAETAKLLADHMRQLNEPGLTEEEAVKRLLKGAAESRGAAYTEVLQMVQDMVQQRWPELLGVLLSQISLQLEELPSQLIDQIQKEVQRRNPYETP